MEPVNACPLCRLPSSAVLTETLRRGVGRVLYCDPCKLGFLDAPTVDIESYYRSQYRQEASHTAKGEATNAREIFEVYYKYQSERLALVVPHVTPESSVLEIGAGSGQFLAHLDFDSKRLCATELNRDCCGFMRGRLDIDADSELLPKSRHWHRQFDIVCAFQVMEHVDDPVKFLDEISHVMKPGGKAFIEVPNLNDPLLSVWGLDAYKRFYYHAQHRLYFTAHSLELAAKMAGFRHREIAPTQDYNLLNHLHWVMNRSPQSTCDIGLGEIVLDGTDPEVNRWLSHEMRSVNERYMEKLKERNLTSNLMLILTKGE